MLRTNVDHIKLKHMIKSINVDGIIITDPDTIDAICINVAEEHKDRINMKHKQLHDIEKRDYEKLVNQVNSKWREQFSGVCIYDNYSDISDDEEPMSRKRTISDPIPIPQTTLIKEIKKLAQNFE